MQRPILSLPPNATQVFSAQPERRALHGSPTRARLAEQPSGSSCKALSDWSRSMTPPMPTTMASSIVCREPQRNCQPPSSASCDTSNTGAPSWMTCRQVTQAVLRTCSNQYTLIRPFCHPINVVSVCLWLGLLLGLLGPSPQSPVTPNISIVNARGVAACERSQLSMFFASSASSAA